MIFREEEPKNLEEGKRGGQKRERGGRIEDRRRGQ
jgi:hypothetical protein